MSFGLVTSNNSDSDLFTMSLVPLVENGETRKKKKEFYRIFQHFCIISALFYITVSGDCPRTIGSRYGSVSLASQSRDTEPCPETLPLINPYKPSVSVLGYRQTVKTKIRHHRSGVWSGSSLFANRNIYLK